MSKKGVNRSAQLEKLEESRVRLRAEADHAIHQANHHLATAQALGYKATIMAQNLTRFQMACAFANGGKFFLSDDSYGDALKKFKMKLTTQENGVLIELVEFVPPEPAPAVEDGE